ncbi:MAG: transglycosylase SLT domain-containing protein [Bacteroides sp.]|jgi:membrane-bound lytic murein transglycosylase D|nr:transglycosylase SLT domain-containing protein [Bacteroides sp.]MBQ5818741.1 transglycosylase SLT domain-containing protein [Bacteroides sp.]
MNKLIALLTIILCCNLPISAQESEEMPLGMTMPIDSLLNEWKTRTNLIYDTDCTNSAVIPQFSDSIYIDRLQRMPTIMEMPYNAIVREYIDRYAVKLRNQVSVMLAANNFYMPLFEEALDAYDLPLELKYLPIIESALKPTARSRAGALGLWQFMLKTGRLYGLESNSLVDDRLDPIKATWAAARYLREMYDIYQDWHLVIAAYNCGPGNVNKAIRRAGGATDYWSIYNYLPRETRGYVPAFIAANYIMTYYCHHNICPMNTEIIPPTDTLQISRELHLQQVADVCDITIDELKSLNPQYKRNIIPGNTKPYTLRLPQTKIATFIDNQDTIYNHRAAELFKNRKTVAVSNKITPTVGKGTLSYHTIRSGETLSTIAQRYGVKVSQLKDWNGLSSNRIRAGKKLKIYK